MSSGLRVASIVWGTFAYAACATIVTEGPPAAPAGDLAALEVAVREDSTDVEAVTWLAASYAAADRVEDARALLARSMAIGPYDESVLLMLALAEEELGQLGTAGELHRSYLGLSAGPFRPLARIHLDRLAPALTLADLERLEADEALPARAPNRGRVAVLPFLGDPADARRGLQWLMEAELEAVGFDVVDPVLVGALLALNDVGPERATEIATAIDIMGATGAGAVVQGSAIAEAGDGTRLDLHVVMLVSAGAYEVSALPAVGTLDEALLLPALLARGIRDLSRDQPLDVEASSSPMAAPSTTEALIAFGRGLRAIEADDWPTATREFAQAERLDPTFEPALQWRIRSDAVATAMETPLSETFQAVARAGQLQRNVTALRGAGSAVGTDRRSPVSDLLELDRLGANLPLEIVFEVDP